MKLKHLAMLSFGVLCSTQAVADMAIADRAYAAGDFDAAFAEYTTASDHGNSDVQFMIGKMYANGQATTRSYELAALWYRRSANQGNARAKQPRRSLQNWAWCPAKSSRRSDSQPIRASLLPRSILAACISMGRVLQLTWKLLLLGTPKRQDRMTRWRNRNWEHCSLKERALKKAPQLRGRDGFVVPLRKAWQLHNSIWQPFSITDTEWQPTKPKPQSGTAWRLSKVTPRLTNNLGILYRDGLGVPRNVIVAFLLLARARGYESTRQMALNHPDGAYSRLSREHLEMALVLANKAKHGVTIFGAIDDFF